MTNPCKLAIDFLRDELEFREVERGVERIAVTEARR